MRKLAGVALLVVAVLSGTLLVAVLSACSSSPTSLTLHGTYTDTEENLGSNYIAPDPGMTCGTWEGENLSSQYPQWQVSVKVDGVDAGNAPINWSGKPFNIISGYECTGTWSLKVSAAHIGYQLSVSGVSGTYTVSPSQAAHSVDLGNG